MFSPPPSPPIEWQVEVTATFGNRQTDVVVNGCRTIFPAFEIYAGGVSNATSGEVAVVQRWDSGNINDLFRGCHASGAGLFTGSGVVR